MPEGMSLAEFAAAEEAPATPEPETPDVAPEPDVAQDDSAGAGDVAPDEKPAGTLEDALDAEEASEAGEPAGDPEDVSEPDEGAEEEDDGEDLVVEMSKRGYPKPDFDPAALEGDALKVQQHWRNVRSVDRKEEKAFRAKYDGLDPEAARRDAAAQDELWTAPEHAVARAVLDDDGSDPGVALLKAYVDTNDPSHLKARRVVQLAISGEPAPKQQALTRPGTDAADFYDTESGEFDQQKYAAAQAARDRQVFEMAREKFSEKETKPNPEPQDNGGEVTRDYEAFCAATGIEPEKSVPLFTRAFNLCKADGVAVPAGLKGFKILWDRVQEDRRSTLANSQAKDVTRARRASAPRPRSATSESGPAFKAGMTLAQYADAERAAES